MTRVNLVDPKVLIDQHLVAEYREIVRVVNGKEKFKGRLSDCPDEYVLGPGHVKFFYPRIEFIHWRHNRLVEEMHRRGFNTSMGIEDMHSIWQPSPKEIDRSRARIRERILDMRPEPRYNRGVMVREVAVEMLYKGVLK